MGYLVPSFVVSKYDFCTKIAFPVVGLSIMLSIAAAGSISFLEYVLGDQ